MISVNPDQTAHSVVVLFMFSLSPHFYLSEYLGYSKARIFLLVDLRNFFQI